MNHAARLHALRDRLERPLFVTLPPNIRYLTGFTGSLGYLFVPTEGEAVFITDGRYGELAAPLVANLEDTRLEVSSTGMWPLIASVVAGVPEIALEADGVTWDFVSSFETETGASAVATTGVVEDARRTKDAEEVEALRAAAAAGDRAFDALGDLVAPEPTESELGWALIDVMREAGGTAAGWDPIVAVDAGASIPHYRSGTNRVGSGLLLLDYGCTVEGYHSDMSRTVWIDATPDDEMARVYRAVAEAQQAGIDAVGVGVACHDVDEACRAVLRSYGYEEQFLHSTGHGVGLEIHEGPGVRRGNDDPLRAGDVVTIEPGVYLPGVGGVRIEDMVLVTETGAEVLTHSSREPHLP